MEVFSHTWSEGKSEVPGKNPDGTIGHGFNGLPSSQR